MSATRSGRLMIIGGGEDKEGGMDILKEFVSLSGGPDAARIVVMTAASEDHQAQDQKYREAFGKLGVENFRSLQTETRRDADAAKSLSVIEWATGVFFTGGDQKRIIRILRDTKLHQLLHSRLREGLVIAGTSAGASMMSSTMLKDGESQECPQVGMVELGEGMGFLPGVILDQHFGQRGRLGRLLTALSERPDHLGVGLGEDTSMIVEDGRRFRVLGRGVATVVDGSQLSFNDRERRSEGEAISLSTVKLHTVGEGHGFDLETRTLIAEPADDPELARSAHSDSSGRVSA